MQTITIVDYRAGNLASVQKALRHLGFQSKVTESPDEIECADRILLPGVGHFATMQRLADSGMKDAIQQAIARGVPFFGICLGMQWLFEGSTEAPQVPSLGLFHGLCERFPTTVKSPHVGWNDLDFISEQSASTRSPSRLLSEVSPDAFVYYTHSYRAPVTEGVIATTNYGGPFAAAVERDNIFGVQFHPEKSGAAGLQILKNFCEVSC
jgi:glutamine amidotransferase